MSGVKSIGDMAAGKAGEYLVCANLILSGYTAFLSEQGLPFDVVVDAGHRLLRVQVKTTRGPRKVSQRSKITSSYVFAVTACGKGRRGRYEDGSVDIFAFVALDSLEIGYLAATDARSTMFFRCSSLRGRYFDEVLLERSKQVLALRAAGLTYSFISRELNLHPSYVARVCNGTGGVKETLDTYLTNLSFEKALERT